MSTSTSTSKYKCSIPGCEPLPNAKYHRIPKRDWRAELWRKAINSPLLKDLEPQELCKHHVCSNHFDKEDYSLNAARCQLDNHVVPHRNMPERPPDSSPEDKVEYVTFGSIIEGLDEKESEVIEEFQDFTETEVVNEENSENIEIPPVTQGLPVAPAVPQPVNSSTVKQPNAIVYFAIPFVPKVIHQVQNLTAKGVDSLVDPENSVPEVSNDGQDVQPLEEIHHEEVKKKKKFDRPKGRMHIPPQLWGYIRNLRGNNVSLQRENNSLRKKNLSLSQRLRRASIQLRRTRELMTSDRRFGNLRNFV